MKIRDDFVTNSSSSSFVIRKKDVNFNIINAMESSFTHISADELFQFCEDDFVKDIYYLVDYKPTDEEMHIWVRRDECMYCGIVDVEIDDTLNDKDVSDEISPKFKYHY